MANPQFENFNPFKEQWDSWIRRFDQWLLLSSFSTGENATVKKRAAFCTYIAIKPVVGTELDRLEKDGVIERVTHSDWATPIVVACKPIGKVRICADFKITLNPVLKPDIHPFPLPEELFHKLNQGCKFSKGWCDRESYSF